MFPYRDDNPTLRPPVITVLLIVATSAVWILVQGAGTQPGLAQSVCELGVIPAELMGRITGSVSIPLGSGLECRITEGARPLTLFTSMFMHGGWFHIIGNMLFLWVFGNNIEDSMGRTRFILFYLICGIVAAVAQIAIDPGSPIPMVGASGAISGIMGGYLVLYPRVRVHTLVFLGFFITTIALPAWVMLGYWTVLQIVGGLPSLGQEATGGVAFFAHIGGFLAGLVLIKLFANRELVEQHRAYLARIRQQVEVQNW